MFDWPAQQAPLDVALKQDPDSADETSNEPSNGNGRTKRTRKPSQRAVEMDVPQLVRQGSGKAVTMAAPSSSGSVPGQSKGRGRQRANPDAPETAQQRAHRKFYLRKKEALSSLEAIAAAKAEEYEALRAENEALRRKHAGLAATVAGRDTMLGVLSSISDLSLQDDDEQQQQQTDGATPPQQQQQRQQWQRQQHQWLHDLLPGPLHGAQQQQQQPQQQQPASLPAVQRAQSLTPSLQSEQRTCSQGLHSDRCCSADGGPDSGPFASVSEQPGSSQGRHSDGCGADDGTASAAFDDGPASALFASMPGQLTSEQSNPQLDGDHGMRVPDLSADADAAMTQLLAGFMEGLEASGGAAARAALEASLAADMQQAQQQQEQQQQQQQQASCYQDCVQEEMHDSSSSLTGNACGTSPCCSGSTCELGSSGRGNSTGNSNGNSSGRANSAGMDNSSGRGGNSSGGGSKGGASSGPYSLNGMICWYGGAIKQLGAQLQALDNGDGGQEVQEELERQTKEIMDRLRKFAALDRVHHREMMLINMDTRQRATPPRGHWERVNASAPLDEAKTAQLLACHDVFTEHMAAVRQERTALVQELQRAMSSMPQGDAVLSSSMRRLDEQGQGQRVQQGQGQGQPGGQLSLLDGPAASRQQQLQQRQFGSLSEAEAAFMLMGDLWDDRRQQQQQQPGAAMAWEPPSSFPAAAQQRLNPKRSAAQQLPGWASRPFAKRDPDAASADACLMDTNMTLLKRINDNLAREDLVNHMLAYALGHVLSTTDIARSMVAAWPFYPDTPEVVAATVAAATAAAGKAPGKARNARPIRSPLKC